jgi:hypothetical protein
MVLTKCWAARKRKMRTRDRTHTHTHTNKQPNWSNAVGWSDWGVEKGQASPLLTF